MKKNNLKAALVFLFIFATVACEENTDCLTCEEYGVVETICEDDPDAWISEAKTWDEYREKWEQISRLNPYVNCY